MCETQILNCKNILFLSIQTTENKKYITKIAWIMIEKYNPVDKISKRVKMYSINQKHLISNRNITFELIIKNNGLGKDIMHSDIIIGNNIQLLLSELANIKEDEIIERIILLELETMVFDVQAYYQDNLERNIKLYIDNLHELCNMRNPSKSKLFIKSFFDFLERLSDSFNNIKRWKCEKYIQI